MEDKNTTIDLQLRNYLPWHNDQRNNKTQSVCNDKTFTALYFFITIETFKVSNRHTLN